jgi:protein ImuB
MKLRIACVRIPRLPTDRLAGAEVAALAGALLAAAPRVTPAAEHPLAFWADASGMARRGGDGAVAQALLAAARGVGFGRARVGVAGSCIAAAVATREPGVAWRVVPPGRDASFLARRSLDHLPMEPAMREALQLLGLRHCGELAGFAAADVELRWGAHGVRAWRLARGEDDRWPFRPPPPERASAEAEWEPPVTGMEPLRFVLRGLLSSVTGQIAGRQRVPALLRLTLWLDGAPDEVHEVRPARATADARVLAGLCEQALEEIAAGGLAAPIIGARLEAPEEGAALADQLDAFRPPAPDPAAVHAALLPLLARWGDGALCRARPQGAHLPATHAAWEAMNLRNALEMLRAGDAERGARSETPAAPEAPVPGIVPIQNSKFRIQNPLPLCLRRLPKSRPVRVVMDGEGRPVTVAATDGGAVSTRNMLRAEGPQRLSGSWWADGYAREYWLAEGEDGCLWLLFRDARGGGWWVEGWWD